MHHIRYMSLQSCIAQARHDSPLPRNLSAVHLLAHATHPALWVTAVQRTRGTRETSSPNSAQDGTTSTAYELRPPAGVAYYSTSVALVSELQAYAGGWLIGGGRYNARGEQQCARIESNGSCVRVVWRLSVMLALLTLQ